MRITNRAATLNLIYRNINILSGRMRREVILLAVVVIIAGAALWLWYRPGQENPPVNKCPSTCKYGCLPGTTTCREPPPLTCPPQCKLGCISGTTECKPEVVIPKVKQIQSCGAITESCELSVDLNSDNTCLYIQNDDIILDCKGHSISGSMREGSYALQIIGRHNVTINNCMVKNYASGIFVDSSSNVSLLDVKADNNLEDGILANLSKYISIEMTSASSNGKSGVELISSTDISLSDNTISNNAFGMRIQSSNITAFSNNVICSSLVSDLRCYYEVHIGSDETNICKETDGCSINCSPCP